MLAQEGVNLAIASRNPDQRAIARLREYGVEVVDIRADVSQEDQVQRMVRTAIEELGGLDSYVNNAAWTWHQPATKVTTEFLEKISPDVSVALWREGSVLFEQGTYLDLAFFVTDGEVEVFLEGVGEVPQARPIFDTERTIMTPLPSVRPERGPEESSATATAGVTQTTHIKMADVTTRTGISDHEITFLASMDFDLPKGAAARLEEG